MDRLYRAFSELLYDRRDRKRAELDSGLCSDNSRAMLKCEIAEIEVLQVRIRECYERLGNQEG